MTTSLQSNGNLRQLQFSGHETFPMRYGWLKKAFDAVELQDAETTVSIFNDPSSIALFGVGKNMVASMRHWAIQCELISFKDNNLGETTSIGKLIFADDGLDPYMENPSTLWLLHWFLASTERLTTWFWVFNRYHSDYFERETLTQALIKYAEQYGKNKTSPSTIKRDVECFVRTYAPKNITKKQGHEDALESPLTELGLIKATGKKDGFRIVRGSKPTLSDGVFAYSVNTFFNDFTNANAISLEALLHHQSSPGRVFQLSEDDIVDRLIRIETVTNGLFRWSETAGLKQLLRTNQITTDEAIAWLKQDYMEKFNG